MEKKISIIMPVYNAEKYLYRSINSIINQTFKDWELIIIDDGSTDGSSYICDSFAANDNRIMVIHKKNEGVAIARQIGINMAKGEYSIHCDSDDWVESNMLEVLHDFAQKYNADIVISDYYINTDSIQKVKKQKPSSLNCNEVLLEIFNNKLFGALWNKLIRTNLYERYNAKFFKDINYCEDLLILVQLLQHEKITISYCPLPFYHYYFNPNSITNKYTYETYKTRLKLRDKIKEILVCSNAKKILEEVSFGIFCEAFIFNILSKNEINEGMKLYKNNISNLESSRWKLGFFFLKLGFYSISRKLIKY